MRNPLETAIQRIHAYDPLLLSHHPTCEYYGHHTFELYGAQLCMGCFIVYPVSAATTVFLAAGRLLDVGLSGIPTAWLYLLGAGLGAPMVLGKVLPGTRGKRTRMVGKFALAVGLAVAAFPALFRPADRLVTAVLLGSFLTVYVGHKVATIRDDCRGCPEAGDFPECSGLEFHRE